MGALAHLVETRALLSDETLLLCSSRQTWSGAPVAHFFEVAEAQGAAVSKNDTCGIRAHAGRPHRLSRPTAKVSSASSFQRLRHIQRYVAAALLLQALAFAVQQKGAPRCQVKA